MAKQTQLMNNITTAQQQPDSKILEEYKRCREFEQYYRHSAQMALKVLKDQNFNPAASGPSASRGSYTASAHDH